MSGVAEKGGKGAAAPVKRLYGGLSPLKLFVAMMESLAQYHQ